MIIAVCLKQVSYLYARTGTDPERMFVGPWDFVSLNNPLDEVALEKAVQIKELLGEGEVWALSVGKELVENEARRAFALGSDRFVSIHDPAWGDLDARSTGLALSRAVMKISASLVLCGARSLDLARGEVGCYLASHLGYPYVSSVVNLEIPPGSKAWVIHRSLGKGFLEELECRLPLVLAVEKNLCEPRYPSHCERLKAQEKEIIVWQGLDLDLEPATMREAAKPGPVTSPRPRPKWIPVPDSTLPAIDRIRFLLSPELRQKEGALVEDEPEVLAARMIDVLRSEGLLQERHKPLLRTSAQKTGYCSEED
jgi:electron transfer flavoprotein beta subunit